MRYLVGIGILLLANLVHPASAAEANLPRFSGIPAPSNPNSIWLIDTFTGALSRCEARSLDAMPVCSPWASAPGANASYRYDPTSKNLIPMNDAARLKDAKQKKSN